MDTSETYIKMRLAAVPELGHGALMQTGRTVSLHLMGRNPNIYMDGKGDLYCEVEGEPYYCQVERQDQLQEMILAQDLANHAVVRPYEHPLIDNLLVAFMSFCNKQTWMGMADGTGNRPSMEQLWLAFVMKEKHNKVRNGSEWTKLNQDA